MKDWNLKHLGFGVFTLPVGQPRIQLIKKQSVQ
jgi:hypothetical protein